MKLLDQLTKLPLFRGIEVPVLRELNMDSLCKISHVKEGEVIHLRHEKCTHLDIIVSGMVSVQSLEPSGSLMTIASFGSGDSLGSNLLFSSRDIYPMMVVAKTDATLYSFNRETILELCRHSSAFLTSFLKELSDKALVLTGKINFIALKSMRERIVEQLKIEQITQESSVITLPFSKKEWAEHLGVERPSLSRELAKMEKQGLIKVDNRNITIIDIE